MAWDRRGYFYRSRRVNGRVVRDYYGRGPIAEFAAHLLDQARRGRAGGREAAAALDEAEGLTRSLGERLDLVAAAHLVAAGFHRHDRGPWRRRRATDRPD